MKNGEGQNLPRFGCKVTGIFWWTGLIEVPRRHGHCGALIVPRAHVPAISAWSLQLYGQFGALSGQAAVLKAAVPHPSSGAVRGFIAQSCLTASPAGPVLRYFEIHRQVC